MTASYRVFRRWGGR